MLRGVSNGGSEQDHVDKCHMHGELGLYCLKIIECAGDW